MNKEQFKKIIEKLITNSPKKNFDQSVELIFSFKDLNLKKPEEQLDYFIKLPHGLGKKFKICALVSTELEDEAKKICDSSILAKDFPKYQKDIKSIKKLASTHKFFIAQANIMQDVAKVFGRTLGPRYKMPNPKGGCVVPPKTSLKPLYEKLQDTIHIRAKDQPVFQTLIGKQSQKVEELANNATSLYDSVIHHLPKEGNNLKSVYIKLTMSKPVKIV